MRTLGCVTGRFQPVHEQHLELFGIALAECAHQIVAVTNPDTGISLAVTQFVDHTLGKAVWRAAVMYGVGVGQAASGQRLISA